MSEKRDNEGEQPPSKRHCGMQTLEERRTSISTQTDGDSQSIDKVTGINVILHDGPMTGNTSCIRFSRTCRTDNAQTINRDIFNCKRFSKSKAEAQPVQCTTDVHTITDDYNIMHNDIKVGQSGLKSVYLIYPTAATNYDFQSTQTIDTTTTSDTGSSTSKVKESSDNPDFSNTPIIYHPIGTAGTNYLEPGIITLYVNEDKRGIVQDMRFELKPPVIKYMSDSTQTDTETVSHGTSLKSITPSNTNPKLITGVTPPFIIKYECIKYLSESTYIIEKASESTHPEIFPSSKWFNNSTASDVSASKNSDQSDTSQTVKVQQANSTSIRSFSMKLTYSRAKFSECSSIRIRTNVNLRTKLMSSVYNGSYLSETTNREDARNTLLKQPGFKSWLLSSEIVPTELLTDSTGIRGVYVKYICTDMQDLISMVEKLFRIMYRRQNKDEKNKIEK